MRTRNRRNEAAVTDKLIKGWPDEIARDVLELWIGISRLMARISGSDRQRGSGGRRGPDTRSLAPRRKA
jgi:hypothetical protein